MQAYIDTWAAKGEVAAMNYAIESAREAAAHGEHGPCPDPELLGFIANN